MLHATDGQELGHQAQGWNALLDIWTWAQTTYGLTDGDGAIAASIAAGETQYYEELYGTGEDRDINAPLTSNFLDYVGTIKWQIIDKFNELKADAGDADGLDWDTMIAYIQGIDANQLFVNIVANYGDLSGGHGKGWMWWVGDKTNAELASGSVPDSTHGRNDGALNGTKGSIRDAISGYNYCIDNVVASITWPLGY